LQEEVSQAETSVAPQAADVNSGASAEENHMVRNGIGSDFFFFIVPLGHLAIRSLLSLRLVIM